MAEIQLRNLENKLRSSEYYSIRSGYEEGSRASVYWTPPTALDGFSPPGARRSDPDAGPQMSPIHINYINENLDAMIALSALDGGPQQRAFEEITSTNVDDDIPLQRMRLYMAPQRMVGGSEDYDLEGAAGGFSRSATGSADVSGSTTQSASHRTDGSSNDDDSNDCGAAITTAMGPLRQHKVTAVVQKYDFHRSVSQPHEHKALLLRHDASVGGDGCCHGGSSRDRRRNRKRFNNEYYYSVGNVYDDGCGGGGVDDVVAADDDGCESNDDDCVQAAAHHSSHSGLHKVVVLPHTINNTTNNTTKPMSALTAHHQSASSASSSPHHANANNTTSSSSVFIASKSPSCRCCQSNSNSSSSGNSSLTAAVVGAADVAKVHTMLDETGKSMLVNQCDNHVAGNGGGLAAVVSLLQTSASMPTMHRCCTEVEVHAIGGGGGAGGDVDGGLVAGGGPLASEVRA